MSNKGVPKQEKTQIIVPGPGFYGYPPGECLQIKPISYPLNNWAAKFADRTRVDLEGRPVREDRYLSLCDRSNNNMYIQSPGPDYPSYSMPGGVRTAIRFFTN